MTPMTQIPTLPAADVPTVDTHAHAYTLSMPLAPGAWHAPQTEATVEQYLDALDHA